MISLQLYWPVYDQIVFDQSKAGGLGLNRIAAEDVYFVGPLVKPGGKYKRMTLLIASDKRGAFSLRGLSAVIQWKRIVQLQKTKRDLAEAIINADNSLIRNPEWKDLELLLF